MEKIDIINRIAKISCINIITYLTVFFIICYKKKNKKYTFLLILSVIEGILCIFLRQYIETFPAILINFLIQSLFVTLITNNKFTYSMMITSISYAITYLIHIITVIITAFLLKIIYPQISINNILILLLSVPIEITILYNIFKVKRMKDGIQFLKNKEKISNIGIIGVILIEAIILIYSIIGTYNNRKINTYMFIVTIILTSCMFIWTSRKITSYYKQKMKEKTIEELENELKEKEEEINKILEENKSIATINHKYSSRIKALENLSNKLFDNKELVNKMKEEFGEEFGDIQNQINTISKEFTKEMNESVKHSGTIPKTGIFGIDNIIEFLSEEAKKSNIELNLKLNGNIIYMVQNVISQSKLETILGDHIKDAIIAINSGNNNFKKILVIIGIVENCYEVKFLDTGIEFEIETLLKLGTEAITTHKETGGSGIGFITTFETLNELKASLIIEEKHEMTNTDYTKAINIRFDGKGEYKIKSYRAEKIREQNKENRIIIEN